MSLHCQFILKPQWLIACLALAVSTMHAQDAFSTKVYPDPVNVEGEKIFTQLHLKLGEADLGFPLLGRPELEGETELMVSFLEDLMTEQIDRAVERSWVPSDVSPDNVREMVVGYNEVFSGYFDSIRLDKVVALGRDRLLLWSFPFEDEKSVFPRVYRSLRFVRPDAGSDQLLFEGVKRDPLAVLINSLYEEAQGFPDGIPNRLSADFEYGYAYPAHEGENAVEFLFNGETLKTEVLGSTPGSMPSSVAFYRHAVNTMVNASAEEYAALLGADSAARVRRFSELKPEEYEAMVNIVREVGKTVFFVLEADPVYYIFYLPSSDTIQGAPFSYDMVWRSPEGEFREVNVFRESFFDDIILQRGLFEEPFLRPTLVAENLIDDERVPLVVSVSESEFAALAEDTRGDDEKKATLPDFSTEQMRKGLPWWIWLIVAGMIALLAYYFWRQRAHTTHA